MVLGDLNAKCGREVQFSPTVGKESLHNTNNGNGFRLISFVTRNNVIMSNTTFPHKKIFKSTRKSPDGVTDRVNQIDHVLIQKKFRSYIIDVRNYKGTDSDMNNFLVIAKFKLKVVACQNLKINIMSGNLVRWYINKI